MRNATKAGFALAALISLTSNDTAEAQNTAFTYQGRLSYGGAPAQGAYDLLFTLYDSMNEPGTVVAGPYTNSASAVANGIFTVALDFGADAFPGADRWLEIAVRTNGSTGGFTILSPRQPITATPYALMAKTAARLTGGGSISNAMTAVTATNAPNGVQVASTNLATTSAAGLMPAGNNNPNYFYNGQLRLTPIPDAALSSNIPRLDANNVFPGISNYFAGCVNVASRLYVHNGWLDLGTTSRTLIGNGAGNTYLANGTSFDSEDTLVGHNAGFSLPGGVNSFHTFIGSGAGGNVVIGAGSVACGQKAFVDTTNAESSVAIGSKAGSRVPYAHGDTFVGYAAAQFVNQTLTGFRTYIGYGAGQYADGDENVFIGYDSGPQSPSLSSDNVGIGANALENMTTGSQNTCLGYNALNQLSGNAGCTAIGYRALYNGGPYQSTGVGYAAGEFATAGTSCIFLGAYAGRFCADPHTMVFGGNDVNAFVTNCFIGADQYSENAAAWGPLVLRPTGGSGANSAGMGFTISGGQGTGNTPGGDLNLGVSLPSSPGSMPNQITASVNISGASGLVTVKNNLTVSGVETNLGLAVSLGTTNSIVMLDTNRTTKTSLYTQGGVLYSSASPPNQTVGSDDWTALAGKTVVTGIDGTIVGNTPLYTVPAGRELIVQRVVIIATAVTPATTPPTISVGTTASTFVNVIAAKQLTGLVAVNTTTILSPIDGATVLQGGDALILRVSVGAVGTTYTFKAAVIGLLL
jgi:hypothetical protein